MEESPLKLKHFFQSFIQMNEENNSSDKHIVTIHLIMLIHFLQIFSFVLSNFPNSNSKFNSLKNGMKTLNVGQNLLKNPNDNLSLIIYFILFSSIIFFVFYIIFLTILRIKLKVIFKKLSKNLRKINTFISYILMIFPWVIFIPYLSVFIGSFICRPNSILHKNISLNCYFKENYILIAISLIGIIFTVIINLFSEVYNCNYEFLCTIPLKRKYKLTQFFMFLCKILIVFSSFLEQNRSILLVLSIFLSIFSIIDFCIYLPYKPHVICIFYGCLGFFLFFSVIMINFVYFIEISQNLDFFYIILIILPISYAISFVIHERKWENIMKINPHNLKKNQKDFLVYYLEEILILSEKCSFCNIKKFYLFSILSHHRKICKNNFCFMKKEKLFVKNFMDEYKQVDKNKILIFIKEIFVKNINANEYNFEKEYLYLKYITMLITHQENLIQAYTELCTQVRFFIGKTQRPNSKNKHSLFISFLLEIIVKRIEYNIKHKVSYISDTKNDVSNKYQLKHSVNLEILLKIEKVFLQKFMYLINNKNKLLETYASWVKIDFYI